ncbi:MAG: hypothetical protein KBB51_02245, partial [Candidatus Moranbacteria bacterium]|nr:hypothetical protein [Candidatus Moranbacteria bacterium]
MRVFLCILIGFFLLASPGFAAEMPTNLKDLLRKDSKTLTGQEREMVDILRPVVIPEEPIVSANTPGAINCFDHYGFGSVQVDLSASLAQTVPGANMIFVGAIKNNNPYPVVNGHVYVKIFRRDEINGASAHQNGYPLVDQFSLPETYNLPAKGAQSTSFSWKVPMNAEGGEYFAAFFFQSAYRYNLLGLSFTDDVTGNQAQFSVTSPGNAKLVAFEKNTVTLNEKEYRFADFPPHFKPDESVIAKMSIQNPKDEDVTVALIFKHYAWDALRPEALSDTQTELVKIKAHETKIVEYVAKPLDASVSYVVAELKDGQSSSFLDIRFVRDGIDETRINFPSIETYPLQAGQEAKLFSCVHSTNQPVVKDVILTLTLRDENSNVIHTYAYQGDVTGKMMGVADSFIPSKTYTRFTLTATLERDGKVFEGVTQEYDCAKLNPSLCPESEMNVLGDMEDDSFMTAGLVISILVVVFGLVCIGIFRWKKKRGAFMVFLNMVFLGVVFLGETAEAKSIIIPIHGYGGGYDDRSSFFVNVIYSASVNDDVSELNDGSAIPVGSHVYFKPKRRFEFTDLSYFISTPPIDSPYGRWIEELIAAGVDPDWARGVKLHRPTITISQSGTAGLSCWNEGFYCTITSPGTIVPLITFSATSGSAKFSRSSAHGDEVIIEYPLSVSAQSISYSLSAYNPNRPPTNPVISGPASGNQYASLAFSATTTDPDGDNIRYLFDWNSDGVGDEWSGGGGWVASGTSQSLARTWITPDTYTFQVKTQDSQGNYSGWTRKTIRINTFANGACGVASTSVSGVDFSIAPVSGLCNAGGATAVSGTGPWTWSCNGIGAGSVSASCQADLFIPAPVVNLSISPANVDLGDSATLTWSVLNPADTCVASSVISASWNGVRGTSGTEMVTPTASGNYTLVCTNTAEGKSGTKTVGMALNNKLKICENSCNSTLDRTGQTFSISQGPDHHLKACFNPYPSCTNPLGNVTDLAFWNDTNAPRNAFSFPVKGELRPLPFNATENFDVSYGGVTKSAVVQVVCIPNTCSIPDAKAKTDTYCPETVQDTGIATGCDGETLTCPGT